MRLDEATVRALAETAKRAAIITPVAINDDGEVLMGAEVGGDLGVAFEVCAISDERCAYLEAMLNATQALAADWLAMRAELDGVHPPKPEVTGNIISVVWQPGYWRVTKRADPFTWDEGDDR